jgi:sRNA-binding carbon storage regulator CsrA
MLVLARARNQAVVIDGAIRVEVLQLAGDVARLRFLTPRHVPIQRGVAKFGGGPAAEAVNGGIDSSGMGVVDLNLGCEQVITVGSDIHLGLVDIDKTRALLFIDAPREISVRPDGENKPKPGSGRRGASTAQGLLPFPSPPNGLERARENEDQDDDGGGEDPDHKTIPFPKRPEPGDPA